MATRLPADGKNTRLAHVWHGNGPVMAGDGEVPEQKSYLRYLVLIEKSTHPAFFFFTCRLGPSGIGRLT